MNAVTTYMSLPIITLPIVERGSCHQCGICCRGSVVPLFDQDVARLAAQKWQERPEFRGVAVTADFHGRRQLAKRSDGSCVFLLPDGLCLIHKELGLAAKPLICRMFPLQLVPREYDAVLTLRRACPSAAADKGQTVAEQLAFARAYAAEGQLVEQGATAPAFKPGETAQWQRTRPVLEALQRMVADQRYPPIRRLVHGLELCRLLEEADTGDLETARLAELVRFLEEHAVPEAAPHFEHREQPSAGERTLFRQVALEVVRLHPRCRHRKSVGQVLRLSWWAVKMAWGGGNLPRVSDSFPTVTFAALEEPLGGLPPELCGPLDRYFQASASSYVYALAQRSGWSVIESFRQLALLYPLGLWLLRWTTAGRPPTADDMGEIISALDRAQGYSPLTGYRQRSRLRALSRLGALPRLVAWYGR